ncbi:MAG TPA: CheR family methyltransferase, partial [Clostridia bacterium]|nr:CheR family methyltransferase [Clostridia bacterium]
VYSAGCSDGQELYSIAMLLNDLGALAHSHLLGLDCRSEAIAHAKAGRVPMAELEQVPPELRTRYFQVDQSTACVSPELRERVCWQVGDLLENCGPADSWDVILFRNVAIYLTPDHERLWKSLASQLRPGGVLVTGKAERPPSDLPLTRAFSCIYRKHREVTS